MDLKKFSLLCVIIIKIELYFFIFEVHIFKWFGSIFIHFLSRLHVGIYAGFFVGGGGTGALTGSNVSNTFVFN